MSHTPLVKTPTPLIADLWRVTKPGITVSNTLMAAVGLLATWRDGASFRTGAFALFGTALTVAAASTFNMAYEYRRDAVMTRTRERPVAAGRISPLMAWVYALSLAFLGIIALAQTSVGATLAGLLGIIGYSFVYTPLKTKTPMALVIGAFPGATPPLIGALALGPDGLTVGLALYAILFLWQFPHFLAIAAFRKEDYTRAGIRAYSVVYGAAATVHLARWTAWALVVASIALVPLGVLGWLAGSLVVVLAVGFALCTLGDRWVKRTFFASLAYLPLLTVIALVDCVIRLT